MFLQILTLALCLTKASVFENPEETSLAASSAVEPLYNIHEWVATLQLERCAFVAIGLKYFAIFVEDEVSGGSGPTKRNFFLGVCHQNTLEEWTLCSPETSRKRPHKCRFKLRADGFEARVHRRFCDVSLMASNKDCQCEPTILGDEMLKVKGFPTCYMPPVSSSLCKYNVCGLFKCRTTAAEDRVYSVECDPSCRGGDPFCEYPIDRTSRFPVPKSIWSWWRQDDQRESHRMTGRKRFVASCINKYSGRGDVDCLGPGTGCCSKTDKNCSCTTFYKNGVVKLEKTVYETPLEHHLPLAFRHRRGRRRKHHRRFQPHRHIRAPDDEEIEDDDDENDNLDDDIALEENTDEEVTITTTEELEKDEVAKELKEDVLKEVNMPKNMSEEMQEVAANGGSGLSHAGYLVVLTVAVVVTCTS